MTTSTARVWAYRDRQRQEMKRVTFGVFEPEIEKLIRLKYLEPHEREDLKSVQVAVEAFFNDQLDECEGP